MLAATTGYLEAADAFGRWVEACVVLGAASMTRAAAWASWRAWAEAAGEYVGHQRRLNERLSQLPGVDEARLGHAGRRAWIGVGLRGDTL